MELHRRIVNIWVNIRYLFHVCVSLIGNWLFKVKRIAMYFRVYNIYRGKVYDNKSIKKEKGEWKYTIMKFLHYIWSDITLFEYRL